MILDAHNKKRIAIFCDGSSKDQAAIARAHHLAEFVNTELNQQSITVLPLTHSDWLAFGSQYEPASLLQTIDGAVLTLEPTSEKTMQVLQQLTKHNIPYVGATPLATSIATNRVLTKDHLRDHSVRLAPHMQFCKDRVSNVHQAAATATTMFSGPYIVRPVKSISGVRYQAPHTQAVSAALGALFQEYDDVLVEQFIAGIPASCVVVEGLRAEQRYTLPVTEQLADTQFRAPSRFSAEIKQEIKEVSLLVHEVLGLRHHSESYFVVAGNSVYFTRVSPNPVWGTHTSAGIAAEAVGLSQSEYNRHLLSHLTFEYA